MNVGTLKQLNEKLKDKNPEIVYKIVQFRETRSHKQNNFLHACFNCIGSELGYETEEIKDIIKRLFLSVETPLGPYVKRTRKLDTKELTEFINKFIKWASIEHGIYVPSPNDKNINEFYSQYGY